MQELRDQLRISKKAFYLNELLDLLCGDPGKNIEEAAGQSYEAYAAINMLFCPDLSKSSQVGKDNLLVSQIKHALIALDTPNPILRELYQSSPFTLLEKLLGCTEYGSDLLILVFHMSHLLLRLLLFPDSEESYTVFSSLFTY